ncbi:uncharacterized protein K02A2.6-like [Photinus pyralis]|uniref:uncharacterized protein K02A2.6-like n=1 Tax=Photinus pyralis TaxID=7054 RepID=UPI001266FBD2|nr:uncharacterized protein K02A2.6-like [Photinus pyralis]
MEQLIQNLTSVVQKMQETQLQILNQANPQQSHFTKPDLHGVHLQPFDENNESFNTYIQRLENHLSLRGITDETPEADRKKVQIFLNYLGPKMYQTLSNITSPDSPSSKTYKEVVQLLKMHICPPPSEIAEQHRFSLRVQHEGESIANFVAELKRLTTNCNFKCIECDKPTINTHLRSQFIKGIRDNDIRERLLQQTAPTFTFDKAVELALSIEMSKCESKQLQSNSSQINLVSKINENSKPSTSKKKFERKNYNTTKPCGIASLFGKCFRCGNQNHNANDCFAKLKTCTKCGTKGHLANVCLKSANNAKLPNKTSTTRKQHQVDVDSNSDDGADIYSIHALNIYKTNDINNDKILLKVNIDNTPTNMELDTGAAITSMSLRQFTKICPNKKLLPTSIKLRTYTGEIIKPVGVANVQVTYEHQVQNGDVYIIDQDVDAIFGRDWLKKIKLNWPDIKNVSCYNTSEKLNTLLDNYKDLFVDEIGKIPDYKCSIKLNDESVSPIFMKARPVPYALKTRVEEEILRLEKADIIEKVVHSNWGSAVVPVIKKNGKLRLCADYKGTINKHIRNDKYPIPRIQDIFASMEGGKYFCSLDISQAYLHMEVDEETAMLQAISTHLGTYKVKRLMFGVKIAPNCWQRFMDQLLSGLDGVTCFIDDIKVQGSTYQETIHRLKLTLDRLRTRGLHLNKRKCEFFKKSINYLGHVIDESGLHAMPDKIDSIKNAPQPKDVQGVRKLLGLINYYHRFLPNVSSKLAPLYALLVKNAKFVWSKECETAFRQIKEELPQTLDQKD